MNKIRVLELSGSHYDMGYQHGLSYADSIRHFAQERVRLSAEPMWTGQALSRSDVLDLADACLEEHRRYSQDLVDELQGMADATGLSLAELIIVCGFTDFIDTVYNAARVKVPVAAHEGADNCTAFLVPNQKAVQNHGFYGQTWDMHDTATPHVILLRGKPQNKPEFLAFTTVGCVGMIGMNSEGVAIGINNLSGDDGKIGVTWNFVVRKALEQSNADDALACITEANLAGAHNYMLMDKTGKGYNVEAMSTTQVVTPLEEGPLVHTNHCLLPETQQVQRVREQASQESSEKRLNRGYELLEKNDINENDLQALTRDPEAICVTSKPPRHVETCGAAIMRPATGDFWAVWGLPSENEYEHFTL
ncbi:MAG: hypothetical protein KC422_07800 [Trueperaceae bacterium]|nr:hypothetical protein [Trueperaceae bacterium]